MAYYYQIVCHTNRGYYWPDGSSSSLKVQESATNRATIQPDSTWSAGLRYLSGTLKGWSRTQGGTTAITSFTATITSQSESNPTQIHVYTIWTLNTYTFRFKRTDKVKSAELYVDNVKKLSLTTSYQSIAVTDNNQVELRNIALASSNAKMPFLLYSSRTADMAEHSSLTIDSTTKVVFKAGSDSVGWEASHNSNYYWSLTSSPGVLPPFYWNSASTDASLIKQYEPIANMTASRWNALLKRIQEISEAYGIQTYLYTVSRGDTIYSDDFNDARSAILNLTGHGTLPAAQASGNPVKASLFQGNESLKSALNAATLYYNTN